MKPTQIVKLSLLLSFALSLSQTAAHAELTETVKTEYYTISPATPYDIRRELNWRTPLRAGSTPVHGRTVWQIKWQHTGQQTHAGCRITSNTTNLATKYILPTMNPAITNTQITGRFDKFNDALVKHEYNHGANGLEAAKAINYAIANLPPERNCRQLQRVANSTGQAIIRKYSAIDSDYDRRTQNGRLEGAHIR